MKVLELFAGSRSVGKVAEEMGFEVFSVDHSAFKGIDLVKDIEYLISEDIPFIPDVIWASPPCTTYSIAAVSHHRLNGNTISDFAIKSDKLVLKTLELIKHFDCKYFIENPRGMLRKQKFMEEIPRTTVTYCSYGDVEGNHRMKPTDIWSNHIFNMFNLEGWNPKPICFNGNKKCHHESAPRGSKTGTQGLKNNYERSKIPTQLIKEILLSI